MTTSDDRKAYREAWSRLYELVNRRTRLLRRLDAMVEPAMKIMPATGMVIVFSTDQAREILAQIDDLTPLIDRAIEETNRWADKIRSPTVRWQISPTRD
jgi:hypothetical protein